MGSEVKRMTQIATQRLNDWMETTLVPSIAKRESFDVSEEMSHLFFTTIMDVGFEYNASKAEFKEVTEALELTLKEFTLINPLRPIIGLFIPERRRAFQAAKYLQCFMTKVLKAYREKEDKS